MTKAQTQKTNESQTTALTETKNRRGSQMERREPLDAFSLMTSPFTFMRRFTEEFEKLFADLGVARETLPFTEEWAKAVWSPKIEIFERGNQLVVSADLPGLSKDDVKVEFFDNRLTIEGERRQEKEEKGEGFYRSERKYGSFYRDIPLPKGADADHAKANFKNGVLEITMPVPPKPVGGKRIEISG